MKATINVSGTFLEIHEFIFARVSEGFKVTKEEHVGNVYYVTLEK